MHKKRRQRALIILSLTFVLLLMSAGYAAFQGNLKIKGTTRITSLWDVRITNVTSGTPTGSAVNKVAPTWDTLTANMEADLFEKGDAMEYDVTIKNNGTIDAVLSDVIGTPSNSNAVLITFSGFTKGEKLYKKGHEGDTKVVHVKIEYNPEYDGGETSGEAKVEFNYTQGEGGDIEPVENAHLLTYNFVENGGRTSTATNSYVTKNTAIDLTPTAVKTGYEFVGWNTNKDATSGLSTLSMGDNDITLYAIFKKEISITYKVGTGISKIGTSSSDYTENYTLYNNNNSHTITLPSITLADLENSTIDGWYKENNKVGNPNETYAVSSSIVLLSKAIVHPVINNVSTSTTTTTITVVADASFGGDSSAIKKYEFSSDGGTTWVDNGTSNVYTFTGLSRGNSYTIKVRVTGDDNLTSTSNDILVTTDSINAPTFTETVENTETIVNINFPEDCTTKTCTYQKDSGEVMTVTDSSADVAFATSGTVTASISDGTNTVTRTYNVEFNGTLSNEEAITTTDVTTWTAPVTGEYFLEVWGAQGGSYSSSYGVGGKGGYSYGYITLNQGDTLYIHNGGQGSYGTTFNYTTRTGGGTNGGGAAAYGGGTGGGASDIRVGTDDLNARVIVAGGGGGAYSYDTTYKANGGYGGGETAGDGGYYSSSYTAFTGKGATQTAGGAGGTGTSANYNGAAGTFGTGGQTGYKSSSTSYYSNGAGGGGWYGGGGAGNYYSTSTTTTYLRYGRQRAAGGGGGSGYVYTENTASNYPEGCLLNSSYYLRDAATIGGDQEFNSPTGTNETGHSGNGSTKISYEFENMVNSRLSLAVDSTTTNSISVTATPETGVNITKYEFSSDNGATWTSNGTSNTYTFTGLTHNTIYNLKVRGTTSTGKVVSSAEGTTNSIVTPTFSADTTTTGSVNTTITYPSGCGSTLTCTYQKSGESVQTVTSTTQTVSFSSPGTLTATVTDGTNTLSDIHTPTETITMSKSTTKTTNSITVTANVTKSTGVTKYEFTKDGGTTWVDNGTSNVYKFEDLDQGTAYQINVRITTNFGNTQTSTVTSVTTNTIATPTYTQTINGASDVDVTITYPSGCGSTYTCTYTKDNGTPVTVTSTTATVNFDADGELLAEVTDGHNTVSSSYTMLLSNFISTHGTYVMLTDSGDGLYDNGDGSYTFKGADPDNYLKLGSDNYRIMGIESDGTLKVIKTASINKIWDPGYSSTITVTGATKAASTTTGTRFQGLSSNTTDYCVSSNTASNGYSGCKVWGSADTMRDSNGTLLKDTAGGAKMPRVAGGSTTYNLPNDEAYINYYLNNDYLNSLSYKELIETHSFDVGAVESVSSGVQQPIATNISQAHAYTWQGKIGLMTAIDYVKANTNTSLCGTVYLNTSGAGNYTTCKTTNWLFNSEYQWTMSTNSHSYSYHVWLVNSIGDLNTTYVSNPRGVRPVFYLSSDIQLTGNGTSASDAYTIAS